MDGDQVTLTAESAASCSVKNRSQKEVIFFTKLQIRLYNMSLDKVKGDDSHKLTARQIDRA